MRLAVVGTGYVGLVAGAGFADFGNDVVCVDVDAAQDRAASSAARCPSTSPASTRSSQRNVEEGRLSFSTDVAEAVRGAEVVFIAVGTPSAHDGSADLSQVLAVAETVGRAITGFTVIVTKSTVPVGTADKVERRIGAASPRSAVRRRRRTPSSSKRATRSTTS